MLHNSDCWIYILNSLSVTFVKYQQIHFFLMSGLFTFTFSEFYMKGQIIKITGAFGKSLVRGINKLLD